MPKKTSIKDIAKSLNVSPTLVSMVLNGKGDENAISPITQQKVLDKAKELHYMPNRAARSLRMGTSETIGLIVSDISNPFYAKIAGRIEKIASKSGYNLFVCSTNENIEREAELIEMLKSRNVDGIIISSSASDENEFVNPEKEKIPIVMIDRIVKGCNNNSVSTDNFAGAYQATKHIINTGFEKIAYFSITPDYLSTIQDRFKGYKSALLEHNLQFDENLVKTISFENIHEETKNAIENLLSNQDKPFAIFTANNSIAISCMKILNEKNIKIPEELALLSFDNIDLFELSSPKITSVAQPVEKIGDYAVEIILDKIKNKNSKEIIKKVIPVELKIRESCGEKI